MMGRQDEPGRLFYRFNLERHIPADHLLRRIDAVLDLSEIRRSLAPYYAATGHPSIDPELMIRMLLIGYAFAIRSERRLCDEVHLNLAYRWFCRPGLEGDVPDHSTFSKNRHGRFRDSDLFRRLFEHVVRQCMRVGLVGGEGFAIDASVIAADASKGRKADGRQPSGRQTKISPARCASISTPSTRTLRPRLCHRRTTICRRAIQRPNQNLHRSPTRRRPGPTRAR